ncbi:thioredoxin family protein [Indiicoccus explosivorum]|uniref:thioredoxin family protein n=1 Tax=Indiicoccus explosivorum TaxID=1917864 RepID=UPI000B447DFB|nr:thioredoxin family protein [Indiicoccus explosivorum]
MKILDSAKEFQELKTQDTAVFLFTAGWCPDCRVIEPVLPEIEEAYSDFTFVSVDRDQFIDLCRDLDVYGIPSFVAFRNGAEIGRFVSKDRKTRAEIESFLDGLQ